MVSINSWPRTIAIRLRPFSWPTRPAALLPDHSPAATSSKSTRPRVQRPSRTPALRTAGAATLASASLPSALAQTEKKVTLALVGVAHIHTPGFIDLLKTRKDVKVKSVWDHDAARAEKSAKDLGADPLKDVKQLWA